MSKLLDKLEEKFDGYRANDTKFSFEYNIGPTSKIDYTKVYNFELTVGQQFLVSEQEEQDTWINLFEIKKQVARYSIQKALYEDIDTKVMDILKSLLNDNTTSALVETKDLLRYIRE